MWVLEQWHGVNSGSDIGVIDSSSCDTTFIDPFWFVLLSIQSFYFQNGYSQYSTETVNCVWGPLWGWNHFSVGQDTCMDYEPPEPFTQLPLPLLFSPPSQGQYPQQLARWGGGGFEAWSHPLQMPPQGLQGAATVCQNKVKSVPICSLCLHLPPSLGPFMST